MEDEPGNAGEETDNVDDDKSESLSKEEKKILNGLKNIFLGKKQALVRVINMQVSLAIALMQQLMFAVLYGFNTLNEYFKHYSC